MIENNFKAVDSNSIKSVLASLLYLLIVGVSIVAIKTVYTIAFISILGYTSPIADLIIFCFIVIFLIRKTINIAADIVKVENLKLYRKLVMIMGLVLVFIYYISSYLGHNLAASILETSVDYNGPIDWFVKYLKAPIDTSGISDFESISFLLKLVFIAITTYAFTRDRGSIKHSAITVEGEQYEFSKYYIRTQDVLTVDKVLELTSTNNSKIEKASVEYINRLAFGKTKVYEVLVSNQSVNNQSIVAIERLRTVRNKKEYSRDFELNNRTKNVFLTGIDIKTAIENLIENNEPDINN